jgi:hypothetical protein
VDAGHHLVGAEDVSVDHGDVLLSIAIVGEHVETKRPELGRQLRDTRNFHAEVLDAGVFALHGVDRVGGRHGFLGCRSRFE